MSQSPPMPQQATPAADAPIAGVVFDFDGTLSELHIDFAEMRRRALAVIEKYGVDPASLPQTYTLESITTAARMLEEQRRPEEAIALREEAMEAVEQAEAEAAERARLFPWVEQVLLALRGEGIPCAVVTRNCAPAVHKILGRLADCLAAVLTREQVTNVKPHPEHLEAARRCLGCSLEQPVIMVGDHSSDIQAGRQAGMVAVGVLSGATSVEALAGAGAHFILPDGAQLPDIVRAWNLRAATLARSRPAGRAGPARAAEVNA